MAARVDAGRHGMCPPPERATPPLALASRADGGRDGPCWVSAPKRTAPKDGEGRGRGTRSTAPPRSGSASLPGGRPAPLPEVAGWQTRVLRHVVEHLSELAPLVQIIDAPVPQMVDQLPTLSNSFVRSHLFLGQVIEVPKILLDDVPVRTAVRVPQLAQQLVEVPTIISYSSLQRTVEQHVDIPVPGGGGPSFGLQDISSGQSSTATPSSKKRIPERIVEQIVDSVTSEGQSSSSHSPAGAQERADEPGEGVFFFRTLPQKKVRSSVRTRDPRVPASVSPSMPATQLEVAPMPDSIEWVQLSVGDTGKAYYWNRRTRVTRWKPPSGIIVVWVGTMDEEEVQYYWHRDARVSAYDLPPLRP